MADESKASAGANGAKAPVSREVERPASDRGVEVPRKALVPVPGLSAQLISKSIFKTMKLKIVEEPALTKFDTVFNVDFDVSRLIMRNVAKKFRGLTVPRVAVNLLVKKADVLPSFDVIIGFDRITGSLPQLHILVHELVHKILQDELGSGDTDWLLRSVLLKAAERARANYLASGGDLRAVEEFAVGWLMLKPSRKAWETTMEAVVDVLLSDDWRNPDGADDRTHATLRGRFRASVKAARRVQKPLWENKIRRGMIGSLNVTRRLPGGGETEVGLLLPSDADVEATVLGRVPDGRPLSQAMAKLTATEQEIALLFASGQSWKEAAASVGQPETAGWNVCRKLKRSMRDLVDRQQRRQRTIAEGRVA